VIYKRQTEYSKIKH